MLVPKLFTTLKSYSRPQLLADLTAGVIVAVVALPLAIAFAIASGVTPDRGLYTAIVAGFLISALGGSRVQIGGPTGAFVVIVYGIVQKYGVGGLTIATIMGGVILVVMGLVRLGGAIKFIPYPVVTGFTAGIAVIIFTGQIGDFGGLHIAALPADFIGRWHAYATQFHSVDVPTLLVGVAALAILIAWPRVSRRVPGPFVALIVTTLAVQFLHLPVETIGGRFGNLAASLPHPVMPHITLPIIRGLIAPAFTIAMLAAIESLLSAVVADGMIGGRHRSNMELVAQGIANIASPLFGGIPATGAIARTATNVKNGGRTPIAGMTHAVTLLLITLFFGRWAGLIPLATLAAILIVVAYHMSEWRTFRAELTAPTADVAVLLVTFLLTVFVDLTLAVEVGVVLAAFLFMRRMSEVTNVSAVSHEFGADVQGETALFAEGRPRLAPGIQIYAVDGPFFFGAAAKFKETLRQVSGRPRALLLLMRNVPAIDSTGLAALRDIVRQFRAEGTRVILVDVHAQPLVALSRSALLAEIGEENLIGGLDAAIALAESTA